MDAVIREYTPADADAVADLSLRAWAPVFASMESAVGSRIFHQLFGGDWRAYQERDVRRACETYSVWVAVLDDRVVGFTAVDLPDDEEHGEIYMLAVDPDVHGRGIGTALTEHGVEVIRQAGRTMAVVATGGDPGHAPARATYEKTGFTALPQVQYYRLLSP